MNKQKSYFENLDALRFFAFLAVFLLHRFHKLFSQYHHQTYQDWGGYKWLSAAFSNGHLGVNFFFVLSGFLITYLLLKEKTTTSKLNVPHFYVRRFLRIWPLYFLIVFIGFVLYPSFHNWLSAEPYSENATLFYYLAFISNFDIINNGLPTGFDGMGILWSIAIEEQFYLVWPLILLFIPHKKLPIAFAVIIITSIAFRFVYFDDYWKIYFHTLSVMSDLCIGALSAWFIIFNSKVKEFLERLKKSTIVAVYVIGIALCLFRFWLFNMQITIAFERVVLGLFFAFVILEQNYSLRSFYKFGRLKSISFLGKISYGLYCFHIIGIMLAYHVFNSLDLNDNLFLIIFGETFLAFGITILLSIISYKYFESYSTKLKDKL